LYVSSRRFFPGPRRKQLEETLEDGIDVRNQGIVLDAFAEVDESSGRMRVNSRAMLLTGLEHMNERILHTPRFWVL
jgi:hypothetical protein